MNKEEYISLDALRQMLHISKRKAKYLLDNGIIPCIKTGKSTWQYQVKLSDAEYYMSHPYIFPQGMFSSKGPTTSAEPVMALESSAVKKYFRNLLRKEKDMLDVARVRELIGYNPKTVWRWFKEGRISHIKFNDCILVPKADLYAFLISEDFMSIKQKSPLHLQHIQNIKSK